MARRYTEEQHAFLKSYIPGHSHEKVAEQFNKKWPNEPVSEGNIHAYASNHHITNGLHGHAKSRFTPEQEEWLRNYIPGHHHKEVAEAFNEKWPETPFTEKCSHWYARNHRIKTGFTGKFEKGHKSEYGFKKGCQVGKANWFKKGHVPFNKVPVGTIRVRRYKQQDRHPETFIKVAEPNQWQLYGRWLWEQHHGAIPKGYFVAVRDGDPMNLVIENLRILPFEALGTLVNHSDTQGEMRDVILTLGELRALIRRKKNAQESN